MTTVQGLIGKSLLPSDLEGLARGGINQETAESALLRRVDSFAGAEIVGRNGSGDYKGIAIPYVWPGETHVREYRLRRDHPDIEQAKDGRLKPRDKYLSPPGRGNMLYLVPGTAPEWLTDPSLKIILTEGEKKACALWELAWHAAGDASEIPPWLPVAISGVQNWRGTIGKTEGPNPGERLDVKGPIPDLDRLEWQDRQVILLFDANVHTNDNVRIARLAIAKHLRSRGARILFVDLPADANANGVDDLIGIWGKTRVLEFITTKAYDPQKKRTNEHEPRLEIDQIPSIRSLSSKGIEFVVPGLIAAGAITMLSGESGHGKSTIATALAAAITQGNQFAGRECSRRQVLILDRENGIDVLKERFDRLNITDESGLKVWGGWLTEEAPDPACAKVLAWISTTEPKPVIIVDSLIAFLGGDENSASEVRNFMNGPRRLSNLGAAVIVLHHTGKAETAQEYRGSSDFKGSIDVGINIRNFGEGELGKIVLKAFKARFSIDHHLVLNYSGGIFLPDNRPHAAIRTVTEHLASLLRQNPGINKAEFEKLAVEHKLGRQRARLFLDTGITAGEIHVTHGTHNARFYRLADSMTSQIGELSAETGA